MTLPEMLGSLGAFLGTILGIALGLIFGLENPGSSTLTRWRWYLRQGKPVDSDTHTRRPWTPTKVTWARTVSIVRAVWEHSGCMGDRTARSACGNRRTSVGVVGSRGVFGGGANNHVYEGINGDTRQSPTSPSGLGWVS